MKIIEAIVRGERNPRKLAGLRDPRTRADEAAIARSLQGHWREEHIFELTQALELYRTYQDKISECDREIERQLERFDRSDGAPPAGDAGKRSQGNAPRFDLRRPVPHDGSGSYQDRSGRISESGQRNRHGHNPWPTAKHFASWPESQQPHHRQQGHQLPTKASANRAVRHCGWRPMPCIAPTAAGRLPSPKKAQLGAPKAITATAHKLARIIYSMLRYGQGYVDAGALLQSQYMKLIRRAAHTDAQDLDPGLATAATGDDICYMNLSESEYPASYFVSVGETADLTGQE